jgi:hypothetical protein
MAKITKHGGPSDRTVDVEPEPSALEVVVEPEPVHDTGPADAPADDLGEGVVEGDGSGFALPPINEDDPNEEREWLVPPPVSATKAAWVDWADAAGYDTAGLTKDELVELAHDEGED